MAFIKAKQGLHGGLSAACRMQGFGRSVYQMPDTQFLPRMEKGCDSNGLSGSAEA